MSRTLPRGGYSIQEIAKGAMDPSAFDDLRWRMEEAASRTLERFCKATEKPDLKPEEIRHETEAYILELFDNVARILLDRVSDLKDIEHYTATLRSWCEDVLPSIEKDFRPKVSKAVLRNIERTFGSIEGRITGSVDRGKLAEHFSHWKAEGVSRGRSLKADITSGQSIIAKLPKTALLRMEAATAAFLADYLPKLEREANKSGQVHDAELLWELVVHQFNLVARECLAVCTSVEEFEANLHSDIPQFVRNAMSQYGWLADPMKRELETGFALFVMGANPWAGVPEKHRASVWHVGAFTAEALTHAALELRAEAWAHAAQGGFPQANPAEVTEPSGNEPTTGAEAVIAARTNGQGRKRGPKPDHDGAASVAEIVARVAADSDWRSKLDDICEALDEAQIPPPQRWRKRDRSCNGWATYDERANAVKAIEYRLEMAKKRKKTTPETLS